MGIIDLLFLPASIVFAILGALADKKKSDVCVVLSFVFCTIPPLGSIFDICKRVVRGGYCWNSGYLSSYGNYFCSVFCYSCTDKCYAGS